MQKYEKYLSTENESVPDDIRLRIKNGGDITPVLFRDKDVILSSSDLWYEAGYSELSDGNMLVSMYCEMPGVTEEMIKWWFHWHPKESARYKLWFPGEHFAISYNKRNKEYFSCVDVPSFEENTHYPVEKIGNAVLPLEIRFVSPEVFGFSEKVLQKNGNPLIISGHVGVFRGIVRHTEMAHIFFKTEKGLLLVSRFWIGSLLKTGIMRKIIANENIASGMAEHCCVEYRNLAMKLPELYKEFSGTY